MSDTQQEPTPDLLQDAHYQILVVDDSDGIREGLIIALERQGYIVAGASDSTKAIELVKSTPFDLLLLDLHLPGKHSGMSLLAHLRQHYSVLDLPIIMISGTTDVDSVIEALRQGANDFVSKPFNMHVVRERVKTQLLLKQLKKMNDRLVRTTSHDLKKPVMLMLDITRQFRNDYPLGSILTEDAFTLLDYLVKNGEYMQQIIEELLDIRLLRDGRQQITKQPTDFGAIVRQTIARNSEYANSKGIDLLMEYVGGIPTVQADDVRLTAVLDNLVGNAIKFCPPGSCVCINTRISRGDVLCEVVDDGPGIKVEDMDKLFTEYARLQNQPTGNESSTGLGLAICKEVIAQHGGSIGARNNPECGVTFWIRFPIK
ncbi:MAG: hypothetical protein BMS9Abin33_0943 [Gammaproteobacteria bacterium]|nr:MAG: hypothetical protein BMS9Abin33_0943 [Gammaproteobacteria bacterium]